mgnify:FL=1
MSYFLIGDNNMFKKIFYLLRRVFFSFVILYGFNTIGSNFNLVIPINIITLTSITLLGFPALLSLILLLVIAFWGDKYVR